jgi:hypothetical protein
LQNIITEKPLISYVIVAVMAVRTLMKVKIVVDDVEVVELIRFKVTQNIGKNIFPGVVVPYYHQNL